MRTWFVRRHLLVRATAEDDGGSIGHLHGLRLIRQGVTNPLSGGPKER